MLKVNASGETFIFRNEYEGKSFYSTSLSKKNADGTWDNDNIGVQFRKDVELHNKTKINITNGWLTFYRPKGETPEGKKPNGIKYIFVMEFDVIDTGQAAQIPAGFEEIDPDSVPF